MFETYAALAAAIRFSLPEILWVDLDKKQLDNLDSFQSILTPGVLIGLGDIDWEGSMGLSSLTTKLFFVLQSETYEADPALADSVRQLTLGAELDALMLRQPCISANTLTRTYTHKTFFVVENTYDITYWKEDRQRRTVTITVPIEVLPELTKYLPSNEHL